MFEYVTEAVSKIKKFVRHNDWPITHEIRANLWKELCRDRDFDANKQLYKAQLKEISASGVSDMTPSFLSADGIVVCNRNLRESGVIALKRLLLVVELVRPEIVSIPILYTLSALFLHYNTEEDTFACVMHLLLAGGKYLQQSSISTAASSRTLLALIKKHRVRYSYILFPLYN
ncbi:hypothetical protein AB6A40_010151 [Gnathostoma spinigerum]|uniref:Rab-GAP TBC domain-containing protein n=1 Tax=Gnathostoma spinigerum TaxID=75299 RepID=A0ABD6EWF2_9BILA